jgi:hypothetical protein
LAAAVSVGPLRRLKKESDQEDQMMLSAIAFPAGATAVTATATARVLARCAAAAVAATLAVASTRNMCQTWSVCRSAVAPPSPSSHGSPDVDSMIRLVDDDEEEELRRMERGELLATMTTTSVELVVHQLQRMSRRQLLQLYLDPTKCSAPPTSSAAEQLDLEGEWEGVLLENHGRIMTWVAHLLTHRFFAAMARRQRRALFAATSSSSSSSWWRGKSFSCGGGEITGGANRIAVVSRPARSDCGQNASVAPVEHNHLFDAAIGPTRFPSPRGRQRSKHRYDSSNESEDSGSKSELALVLTYRRHQPWYSPWRTMTDELRLLRTSPSGPTVLLGWGCMAWSGGILNASPFCLYRKDASTN